MDSFKMEWFRLQFELQPKVLNKSAHIKVTEWHFYFEWKVFFFKPGIYNINTQRQKMKLKGIRVLD